MCIVLITASIIKMILQSNIIKHTYYMYTGHMQ